MSELKKIEEGIWEIPKEGKMLVPGRIFATKELLKEIDQGAIQQVKNVAHMKGIQKHSIAMPDMHWGYGFTIGGIAAFDLKEGLVSPGGVGYDINCIPAGTKILHKFGYAKKIEEFEKSFEKERVAQFVGEKKEFGETGIKLFLKRQEKEKLLKITTESGQEILVTKDHPIYAMNGMVEAEKLGLEEVAVYPFEGISFTEPRDRKILDEEKIRQVYKGNKNGFLQVVSFLKKRGLLPLKENNEKLALLAKICGFVQGDGTLHFLNEGGAIAGFYGKKEDLQEIKKDLKELGFSSVLYSRYRKHKIKTSYGIQEFEYEENSLNSGSSALVALLAALGCTLGNKTKNDTKLPSWLLESTLWIKRLYIAAFFGAKLSSPNTVTAHGYNFYGHVLSLNKKQEMAENCKELLNQIKVLLEEFEIESTQIAERKEFVNEKGEVSIRFRLQISSKPENLEKFWSKIGFEYNKKKKFLANAALLYLKAKKKVVKERQESIEIAKALKKDGKSIEEIMQAVGSNYVNKRFVERTLWEGRKTSARTAAAFEKFEEFKQKRSFELGESGFLWDKIEKIEEITFNDWVYDFTVKDENHNFVANNFLVSNCGVRLIKTNLTEKDLKGKMNSLVEELFQEIPAGVGKKGKLRLNLNELKEVLMKGADWCVNKGYGWKKDLKHTEEEGKIKGADFEKVSLKAMQRGMPQIGTIGAGNHFIEVQKVEKVFEEEVGKSFGLQEGQIVVMVHSGSRGCGHQIATDYINEMQNAMKRYGIELPDRQLACAPIESEEGQSYLKAMKCGTNFAFANRQLMTHWIREGFAKVLGRKAEEMEMELLYDIAHNIAKEEKHEVEGKGKKVLVHRKGATRAMPKGREENPRAFEKIGHPAMLPGSMGTASYVLIGEEKNLHESFGSVAHGAGRRLSRQKAKSLKTGQKVKEELEAKGEVVKSLTWKGLAEEMPEAYKDVDKVVEAVETAGIGKKIARMVPKAVIKG